MHNPSPAITSRQIAEIVKKTHAVVRSEIFGMLEYDLEADSTQFEFVYRATPNRELTEFRLGRQLARHFMMSRYPRHLKKALNCLGQSELEVPDVPAVPRATAEPVITLERNGETLFNIDDEAFPPSELAHWITGTEYDIRHALRQAGLMSPKWQPTEKGLPLIGGKRGSEYLFKTRPTFKALGLLK